MKKTHLIIFSLFTSLLVISQKEIHLSSNFFDFLIENESLIITNTEKIKYEFTISEKEIIIPQDLLLDSDTLFFIIVGEKRDYWFNIAIHDINTNYDVELDLNMIDKKLFRKVYNIVLVNKSHGTSKPYYLNEKYKCKG